MSENENLQNDLQKSSQELPKKRGRKQKTETMLDTMLETDQKVESEIVVPEKLGHWINDDAVGTKTCDVCDAVMRGWAYRELFNFCPKCGTRMV